MTEAEQGDGHVVMPATEAAALEMVQAEFTLEVLVDPPPFRTNV